MTASPRRIRPGVHRVLYVLRYYPTLTETFVYREITALRARGVDVVVAALGARADGALQDQLPDVTVIRPPAGWQGLELLQHAPRVLRHAWGLRHLRPRDVARALWLAGQIRRLGVERVHVHFAGEAGEWARIAAAEVGVPYSVTVHGADLFKPRPGLADVLRDASAVVTVAEHHRDRLRAVYGVDAHLVRCGVPREIGCANPGERSPLRLVSVARNVPKKGLDDLVAAVRALPDVTLRLVSDAPPEWSDERIVTGALAPSRVAAALHDAHAFVLPCRIAADGDRDGVPVAMLEAMAAGLPVVTTPVAGIPEVIDEEVGWLVPPDDRAALRDTLACLAADPAARARRGAAARWRIGVLGLTVEAQVDGLLAAWNAPAVARA